MRGWLAKSQTPALAFLARRRISRSLSADARRIVIVATLALTIGLGCTPAQNRTGEPQTSRPTAGPKRIVVAMMSDPPTMLRSVTPGAALPGSDALEDLANVGLTITDNHGQLAPRLAETVPSVENGLWTVSPDGQMELTWTIRAGARWHDGTPITADDFVFTATLGQDKDLPFPPDADLRDIESVTTPDTRTVVATWAKPYIKADAAFVSPRPKHLLEAAYLKDKKSFPQLAYWGSEFVGTGPYRLRDWTPGVNMILEANEAYVLGRPKIDEIEVRFISDASALATNLLASSIDLTLGKSLSLDQALQVRDQWRDGRLDTAPSNNILIYPQLLDSSPPIVGDLRFRKALMYAMDRQQLVDGIMSGQTQIGESYLQPSDPDFAATLPYAVRYEYNPQLAAQMIADLGYVAGTDGAFHDAGGERITVEIRTNNVDTNQRAMFAVADQWKRAGVDASPVVMPAQLQSDAAYVTTFPAFLLFRQPSNITGLPRQHRANTPLPENNYRGANYSRYQGKEFSDLIDQLFVTIPHAERVQILGQIIHIITDQLNMMFLFYDVEPTMVSNRLHGATARYPTSTQAWNAQEWDTN
ncbi:MAG TPA: peptide ABC transporter substrate-binding protein [Chloroflexota bacterium]|nr:peptide ABC transporter substrate-binding protein [Chloroflexota bacterium]